MSRAGRIGFLALAVALAVLSLVRPASADAKKFAGSKDSREKDEPQKFLPDYDKLVEGKKADWVWFADPVALKAVKSVKIQPFGHTSPHDEAKDAAKAGPEYLEQWLDKSPLDWQFVKSKPDLFVEGNVFSAWEPSDAASFWAPEGMANPGVGIELIGRTAAGKIVFEIRHKSRGSTIEDAVENGLEDIVKTIEAGK